MARTLPHVWCPNDKAPSDFSPELRGLFFKRLNRQTMDEMLQMQKRCRDIPGMDRFRDDLDECVLYARCRLRSKRVKC